MKRRIALVALAWVLGSAGASTSQADFPSGAKAPDFARDVEPLLRKYCAGCHGAEEQNGELRLDEYAEILKGGEHGPAIVPGDSKISRIMRALRGEIDAKMPPKDEKQPTAEEIELLAEWIDSGARGPDGSSGPSILLTPNLPPAGTSKPFTAAAFSPDGKLLALARYREVELRSPDGKEVIRSLPDHAGKVNDLAFSRDGSLLLAASGVAGLYGEVRIWNIADGTLAKTLKGHRDVLYAVAISPDGSRIATGSYDKKVILWDPGAAKPVRELTQHNGAIFDLAFSPDGRLLASASADETVKIWNAATGERLDTLGQPEGEQYAVLFSPDGSQVIAAGADNRIRVWNVVSREKPAITPLLFARFAHEGAIVALGWSTAANMLISAADDRTLKAWETKTYTETHLYEAQADVPTAISADVAASSFVVARNDGTIGIYDVAAAEPRRFGEAASVAENAGNGDAQPMAIDEAEPNDEPAQANTLAAPGIAKGVLKASEGSSEDFDLYRFTAKAGQTWVLETKSAQMKSPADTKIEVLGADGQRIERVKLQAVRDSYFTFRGKDSMQTGDFRVHNWEEMKLNQLLYCNGEVVKLFMYPRGPDSGFNVYPNFGQRRPLFDTTCVSHALGEPCYIVEPHAPGETIIPNGLPVFTVYWENDDAATRTIGADSRLFFTAPADGEYLVRVSDTRGFSGESFKYELAIRSPKPDFSVRVEGGGVTVNRGSGKSFKLVADRTDNFEDEIRLEITGLPPGFFVTSPLSIEAGHWSVEGALYAFPDAAEPPSEAWNQVKITATSIIHKQEVVKEVGNLGAVKLADAPKILVSLSPPDQEPAPPGEIPELVIRPGQTITATLRVKRQGFDDVLSFGGDDAGRGLAHGVYVDNIGLNGVLLLAGQTERTVFITADDWVPASSRLLFLRSQQEDGQCSWPVRMTVKP